MNTNGGTSTLTSPKSKDFIKLVLKLINVWFNLLDKEHYEKIARAAAIGK
jgi:hypothetical protein